MALCWRRLKRYLTTVLHETNFERKKSFSWVVMFFILLGSVWKIGFVNNQGCCHDDWWNWVHTLLYWSRAVFSDFQPFCVLGILCHDANCLDEFDGSYIFSFSFPVCNVQPTAGNTSAVAGECAAFSIASQLAVIYNRRNVFFFFSLLFYSQKSNFFFSFLTPWAKTNWS